MDDLVFGRQRRQLRHRRRRSGGGGGFDRRRHRRHRRRRHRIQHGAIVAADRRPGAVKLRRRRRRLLLLLLLLLLLVRRHLLLVGVGTEDGVRDRFRQRSLIDLNRFVKPSPIDALVNGNIQSKNFVNDHGSRNQATLILHLALRKQVTQEILSTTEKLNGKLVEPRRIRNNFSMQLSNSGKTW